MPGEELTIARL